MFPDIEVGESHSQDASQKPAEVARAQRRTTARKCRRMRPDSPRHSCGNWYSDQKQGGNPIGQQRIEMECCNQRDHEIIGDDAASKNDEPSLGEARYVQR